MKKVLYILFIFITSLNAQEAFHNFGNIKIHDQGEIGFHTNLINDGTFNENLGLAGFYNQDNSLTISGTEIPRFNNMEVAVDNNLFLEINTEISNDLNYIIGDIVTPRETPSISLDFLTNLYALEDNLRNTDGYASYSGNNSFTFPIGQDDKLRPLITPNQTTTATFKAAYYNEDPNFPSIFTQDFNTNNTGDIISTVNTEEYWDFDGTQNTSVTLTWDQQSNIISLVNDLSKLRVVGWSKAEEKWLDLGNTNITGDIINGAINSFEFIPNEYEIITFGALIENDELTIYNGVTPNGDEFNQYFVIEGIELFKNNLKIYNRWGKIVYEKDNYKNTFNGVSNQDVFANREDKLPVGTYFYLLELTEEGKSYSGWLYINY